MTREEFDLWIDYHSQECFPGVDTWLRKMPPSKLVKCLSGWWARLRHVQYDHAVLGSRDLVNGGTDPPFGQHVSKVVALAKKYRETKPDDTFDGVDLPTADERLAMSKRKPQR